VWLWFGGIIWCSPQIVVVVVCASLSVKITQASQNKIKAIGESGLGGSITITQDEEWTSVKSENLVPGDLIKLTESNWTLPCDAVIISGTCICDESGLTGESMPVRKSEIPSTAGEYAVEKDSKHTLFAGTVLLQADSCGSIAMVTNTGIRTAKGDLVSMILFPTNMIFEYDVRAFLSFLLFPPSTTFSVNLFLANRRNSKSSSLCCRCTPPCFSSCQSGFSGKSRLSTGCRSSRSPASPSLRFFPRFSLCRS